MEHFSALERASWGEFLSTYAMLDRIIEADLQEHARITHVEFEVLLRLSKQNPHKMRIQDIAAQSILTRSGVSRVVERLEKAGLVIRETADEDKRGAYAVLTNAGMERFRVAMQFHWECVQRNFICLFSDEELTQMAGFWKRIKEQHHSQNE
jgi:DNA-binding MarR family transcriptional regulator